MEDSIEHKTKIVSKGTILFQQGEYCKVIYKLIKSCLKSYVIDKSGKEHILQFAPEDWRISDLDSFLTDKPSEIFIMAIEDSEVIVVRKDSPLNYQLLNRPQLEDLCSTLLKNIVASNRRLIALLASTAEERTDLHFLN